ncbi:MULTISPECIES: hypothetical protein [unclassified Nocardioides]|uniref:hypothetical protein n=1 Tax=unclassified Nocardioides TaxID=2615069 RepID=UPI0030156E04
MIGHLGSRASALLDGQLSAEESERAWAHVHQCHLCRDLVEREGWVKTRLAGLSLDGGCTPAGLKGSLLGAPDCRPAEMGIPPGDLFLAMSGRPESRPRRTAGLAAIGGGAVGAAVMGVLVLGTAPADAPNLERRAPVTSLPNSTTSQAPLPATRSVRQP